MNKDVSATCKAKNVFRDDANTELRIKKEQRVLVTYLCPNRSKKGRC